MDLLLTFDYELFGDGSGDVFKHIIEPTNQILKLCKKHAIKTTIFFEIMEYLRIKEEWEKGNFMGYTQNPVKAIEEQIQSAVLAGHDVQLHIHPQWYNAKFISGKWELNIQNWRLGDFNTNEDYGIKQLLTCCKQELEQLIRKVNPDYKCVGLRAGGYNIMPSAEVYKVMLELGIKYDSSVYPGAYENGNLSKYDYRTVSEKLDYWWANDTDIRTQSDSLKQIMEIPVFALPVKRWKRFLTATKIKSVLFRKNEAMSAVAKEKVGSKSLIEKKQFLLEKEASTWDVCMFSKSLHRFFFKYIENKLKGQRNSFVLIGHPKSLQDEKLFENFISLVNYRKETYQFNTLTQHYESHI